MTTKATRTLAAWRKRVDAYAEAQMRAALAAQGVRGNPAVTHAAAEETEKDMDRLFRDIGRLLERDAT